MSTGRDLYLYRYAVGIKKHRLTIMSPPDESKRIRVKCECGVEKSINIKCFGKTKSCGCALRDVLIKRNTTHGMIRSREMGSYFSMKRRCLEPTNNRYKYYGGKGIGVCDRWLLSFENFYADMGPCPPGHSLERIDLRKGYEAANCKWASKLEQANNKTNNRHMEYGGKTYTMAQLARLSGVPYKTFHARLKMGWSVSDCVEKPVKDVVRY